MMHNSTELVK